MPVSSVNFGRWLERCGFKLAEQPIFNQSVTPVAIVADQQQLVSPILGPSGLHGGAIGGAQRPAIQVVGMSPAWCQFVCNSTVAVDLFFQIGIGPPPTVINAVNLPRQEFAPGGDVVVRRCESAIAPSTDLPVIRIGVNQTVSVGSNVHDLYKPAGGWIQVVSNNVATGWEAFVLIYELPTENAQ